MINIDISKKLKLTKASVLTVKHRFESGKISAIYGTSGAGKTTLLKIIAGLITPEYGSLKVDGKLWLDVDQRINISPQLRKIGFVFQDYALFPNMTVMQNLLYAAGKKADIQHIDHLLAITGLQHFVNEKPDVLSGGQQQRVALARALAGKPQLLLLDEPLSATDDETRAELQQQILQLHRGYKFTALVVSHNQQEIAALTDHVLHISDGAVINSGPPEEIFGNTQRFAKLTGTITGITDGQMEVAIGNNVVKIKEQPGFSVGDTVNLSIDAGNAIISKM